MNEIELEAGARLALDVARGMASATGDERCGTEHLLFGIVATSNAEMESLTDLFVLDKSRVERAVASLREHRCAPVDDPSKELPLSTRAELALYARPSSGDLLGPFDLLLGCLADPRSGASATLRHLGIRPGEIRRLAELGAARLTRAEVQRLVGSLHRRSERHYGWWGPTTSDEVAPVDIPGGPSVVVASSRSAVMMLDSVVAGDDGFGITLTIKSKANWLLPPRWEPTEELIPGFGARHEVSPDVVTVDMVYADGTTLTNRDPRPRFRRDRPAEGSLTLMGTHREISTRRDRRVPDQRSYSAEWWAWPLPTNGLVTLAVRWSAESLRGVLDLDALSIQGSAESVRHDG